jgi:hypothetical protein
MLLGQHGQAAAPVPKIAVTFLAAETRVRPEAMATSTNSVPQGEFGRGGASTAVHPHGTGTVKRLRRFGTGCLSGQVKVQTQLHSR